MSTAWEEKLLCMQVALCMHVYLGPEFVKYLCVVLRGLTAHEATWGARGGLSKTLAVQKIKQHWFPET